MLETVVDSSAWSLARRPDWGSGEGEGGEVDDFDHAQTHADGWSISLGSLPAGLSLDRSTGVISGTPTTTGQSGFIADASDASPPVQTASAGLAITVAAAPAPAPQAAVASLAIAYLSTSGHRTVVVLSCAGARCTGTLKATGVEHLKGGTPTAVDATAGRTGGHRRAPARQARARQAQTQADQDQDQADHARERSLLDRRRRHPGRHAQPVESRNPAPEQAAPRRGLPERDPGRRRQTRSDQKARLPVGDQERAQGQKAPQARASTLIMATRAARPRARSRPAPRAPWPRTRGTRSPAWHRRPCHHLPGCAPRRP